MMFEEPVPLRANHWYVAWARISGPSSDCGSCGQASVTTEDQVVFHFKSSMKSNNGTDVNAGQIPLILYRVPLPEPAFGGFSSAKNSLIANALTGTVVDNVVDNVLILY